MSVNNYGRVFAARSVQCFFVVVLLLLSCVLRVFVIATGNNYKQIQTEQMRYTIDVARLRGTVFDCNMVPLTNNEKQTVAVVAPTPKSIMIISEKLKGNELENALETLKNNKPAICNVDEEIFGEGIATTTVYKRSNSDISACHLVGYTDSTGHGITGLELAYDDLLYSEKNVSAVFTSDGKGNILKGIEPYFENDLSVVYSGIVTTLDINIQNITEAAAAKMNSGCAIVAEVGTGKIRAMASVPTFDVNNVYKSLNAENSPMINRALQSYNVGSVFKPCVAACAIENNFMDYTVNCEGSVKIGDRTFRCHNLSGHGNMNLCDSLAQSCNCFFYSLAIDIGGTDIYKTASKLSIGSRIKIADNMYTAAGNMPKPETLTNNGALANISIGQGNLMANPIAMLNLYLAIADDGSYYVPSVVEKTVKEGAESYYDIGKPTRVMKSETAAVLREYLKQVITDGTGTEAAPNLTTAAGKTGTAQTGRYNTNGVEITNSWFCGFFPADQPEYVIVVMSDSMLNVSTASVFAEIANGITELKGITVEKNS